MIGCSTSEQAKPQADLNLYFDSDARIDSILVTNITQDREFHFFKYTNAINIDRNDSINDLYAISFYTPNDHKMAQLWLDGENLVVRGKVSEKMKIQIDTVIGSALYYKWLDFRRKHNELLAGKPDSAATNDFLITELRNEISSPFSIEIARIFVNRNISNTDELGRLFAILSTQNDLIKNHLLESISEN